MRKKWLTSTRRHSLVAVAELNGALPECYRCQVQNSLVAEVGTRLTTQRIVPKDQISNTILQKKLTLTQHDEYFVNLHQIDYTSGLLNHVTLWAIFFICRGVLPGMIFPSSRVPIHYSSVTGPLFWKFKLSNLINYPCRIKSCSVRAPDQKEAAQAARTHMLRVVVGNKCIGRSK